MKSITPPGNCRSARSCSHESIELLAIRQLALPEEINDFLVADLAGQLVDVVAAVDQLAFVADDVAQARACSRRFLPDLLL